MVNRLIGKREKRGGDRRPFKYRMRTPEDIKKRAEQTGGKWDGILINGIATYRFKSGENCFRIMQPTWEPNPDNHWGYDVWVHQYIGPNNGHYLCLRKMQSKPCPICVASEEAEGDGDKEAAKALSCNRRVLAWVIDREKGKEAEGPKIINMAWSQDRDISSLCRPRGGKGGTGLLIDHPDEGYDVITQRSGLGLGTRYFGWTIDREKTPISDDPREQDKWLDYIFKHPIPEVLKYQTAEYLESVLAGTGEEKDEDLDESQESDQPRERYSRDDRRRLARGEEEVEEEPVEEGEEEPVEEGEEETEEGEYGPEEEGEEGSEEGEEEGEEGEYEGEEEPEPEREERSGRRERTTERTTRPRDDRDDRDVRRPSSRDDRARERDRGEARRIEGRSFRRDRDDGRDERRPVRPAPSGRQRMSSTAADDAPAPRRHGVRPTRR